MNLVEYTKIFTANIQKNHLRDGLLEQVFKSNLRDDYVIKTDDPNLSDQVMLANIRAVLSHYTIQEFATLAKMQRFGIKQMDQLTADDFKSALELASVIVNESEIIFQFIFKQNSKLEEALGNRTLANFIFTMDNGEPRFHSINYRSLPKTEENTQQDGNNQNRVPTKK
jgi:hypothetical protein